VSFEQGVIELRSSVKLSCLCPTIKGNHKETPFKGAIELTVDDAVRATDGLLVLVADLVTVLSVCHGASDHGRS
jgi:hypothetical protein